MNAHVSLSENPVGLYSVEERIRRDQSVWTLVQGILAPIQFLVFAISVGLIAHWWVTGSWLMAAHASVVIKTMTLYAIMITGSIWEKEVFGAYLFARPSSGKTWSRCWFWPCTPPIWRLCSVVLAF
jgi:3-vinyl bacteriochlorophyllide hydratase